MTTRSVAAPPPPPIIPSISIWVQRKQNFRISKYAYNTDSVLVHWDSLTRSARVCFRRRQTERENVMTSDKCNPPTHLSAPSNDTTRRLQTTSCRRAVNLHGHQPTGILRRIFTQTHSTFDAAAQK